MRETSVWSLVCEDPLEKGMATHSSILAWRIPWTEELFGLQSMGSQRVGHDWVTFISLHFSTSHASKFYLWNILNVIKVFWKRYKSIHNYFIMFLTLNSGLGFPGGPESKESACNAGDLGLVSGFGLWVGKIPWKREWKPPPVFLPGESHEQRSLAGYSPCVCKKSYSTEKLTLFFHFHSGYIRNQ